MRCLRTIPSDGTFDQNAATERVKKWTLVGRKLYSYDLKSCTDRFPVILQRLALSATIGHDLAGWWESVMTSRSFWVPELSRSCRYSVGQPMGLLSSWAAMALTHHLVVRTCAADLGLPPPGEGDWDYCILGDDIVINDQRVAERYYHVMTVDLGVFVSLDKSIISVGGAEFCKRNLFRGLDWSPIPVKLVMQVRNYPNLLTVLASDLQDRWELSLDYLNLVKVLPKVEQWRGLKLLTCPLWNSHFEFLWGVKKESL